MQAIVKYKVGYAIGIRFRANFGISDQFGAILDEVLYTKGSIFNESMFPLLQHTRADEKVLVNQETQNRLTFNTSNIILDIQNISSIDENIAVSSFRKIFIDGIMRKYKITQINRIGYINRYIVRDETIASNFLNATIGNRLGGVNDINLQFSKRITISDSLVKKDVYDYHNAIFNIIKKTDKKELFVSVDYQRMYEPFLEGSGLIDSENFLRSVEDYNTLSFSDWLQTNYGEAHVR